jgi:phospho-N-acetylmuramoyl-pentapeptide-transferase
MFANFTYILTLSGFLEVFLQHFWIKKMHSMKIEQVTKMYGPSWHDKTKVGTPSMGGIVFIPVMLIVMAIFTCRYHLPLERIAKIIVYPLAAAAVGFADDWLKHIRNSSEGLRSLQKLALQIIITVPWAVWVVAGPTPLLPNIMMPRAAGILLASFLGVGFLNAVNVTDGLDGLAAGCTFISFLALLFLVRMDPIIFVLSSIACGICIGFLWHNANPAAVFMGDAGSHFLAALLFSICVNAMVIVLIVPLGFIFGIEIISVAIQIFSIRVLHKKVFRMSPIHHHFELLGWKENQIVVRFCLIHLVGICATTTLIFLISTKIH